MTQYSIKSLIETQLEKYSKHELWEEFSFILHHSKDCYEAISGSEYSASIWFLFSSVTSQIVILSLSPVVRFSCFDSPTSTKVVCFTAR